MFWKTDATDPGLDKAIADLLDKMDDPSLLLEDYAKMVDQLQKLYSIKNHEKKKDRVSADTMATIAAHLASIAIIVRHERENVLTTKALSFVHKLIR